MPCFEKPYEELISCALGVFDAERSDVMGQATGEKNTILVRMAIIVLLKDTGYEFTEIAKHLEWPAPLAAVTLYKHAMLQGDARGFATKIAMVRERCKNTLEEIATTQKLREEQAIQMLDLVAERCRIGRAALLSNSSSPRIGFAKAVAVYLLTKDVFPPDRCDSETWKVFKQTQNFIRRFKKRMKELEKRDPAFLEMVRDVRAAYQKSKEVAV